MEATCQFTPCHFELSWWDWQKFQSFTAQSERGFLNSPQEPASGWAVNAIPFKDGRCVADSRTALKMGELANGFARLVGTTLLCVG